MKPMECQHEMRVIEAARSGLWDDELRRHAAECAVCADTLLAARVLRELRASEPQDIKLPDAGLVYWKSQLRARREAAARAAEPIALVERFALVCAALTILGVSIWRRHAIRLWLVSLASGWSWPANAGALQTFFSGLWTKPDSLVVICAVGLLVFLTGVVCLIWNEEKRVPHRR